MEYQLLPLSPFEKEQRKLAELIDTFEYYKLLLKEEYYSEWGGLTTQNHLAEIWKKN